MIRPTLCSVLLVALAGVPAIAAPKKDAPSAAQKEADRHFKAGVALFKEAKYTEALAEFERAYQIAPHPLVLYNIAGCHREMSNYGDAVNYYRRFLEEGKGKVPAERLTTAKAELDGILARIARVTVTMAPVDGVTLMLDGKPLTSLDMPIIISPGEHKLTATAPGRKDAEKTVRVASGDAVDIAMELPELPPQQGPVERVVVVGGPAPIVTNSARKRFALGAAFGTNLLRVAETGAPTVGLGVAVTSRIEVGIDAVVVAYSVIPSVRVRLAGDALSVHATVAMPVSFTDGDMSETFVAGAVGLGVRYRATPALAFRLESLVSFAGEDHGTTLPAFLGGELWF